MCDGAVDFAEIESRHGIRFDSRARYEWAPARPRQLPVLTAKIPAPEDAARWGGVPEKPPRLEP